MTIPPGGLRSPQALACLGLLLAGGCAGDSPEDEVTLTIPEGKNRLALETSPYLLQHADNPVDWYPWGEEAFERARAEDKPILVSIGYSSCHVMEHESFENEEIAALMNELFVCVKVDREERPDVDEIYMTAVQLLGIGGGWPLNVFLTPGGEPIVGGTYFPPRSYANRPGWPDVLRQVSTAWKDQREALLDQSTRLRAALAANSTFEADSTIASRELLDATSTRLATSFDEVHGGFGGAPKFPPHQTLQFLLRRHVREGNAEALRMVEHTLRKMARGGMYDQLGGGFHRYSVDEQWLVPHFEKMLYDNSQLARVYVEAFQVTGGDEYARIAREVLDYQLREMTDPEGGFWSATDADSEGREGIYFVWKKSELEELLGEDAPFFLRAYGVSEEGNFEDVHHPRRPGEEGMNVLHLPVSVADFAVGEGVAREDVERKLSAMRDRLFEHRKSRTYPGLDDKIVTSWNALMIGAMAYAGRVLDEPRYTEAASRAADFVLTRMRAEDGRLLRTHREGRSKIPAFLEDYAFLASSFLDLYEATFEIRWFLEARSLVDRMNDLFWDGVEGGWFHTATDGEELITRVKTPTDGSVPGGNGMAALLSIRLAAFTGDRAHLDRAERTFQLFRAPMERLPGGTMGLLLALEQFLHEDGEIAVVGAPGERTRSLLRPVHEAFLPGTVLALLDPGAGDESGSVLPLLEGKTLVGGREAVYICQNYACQTPITSVDELEKALASR